MSATDHQRTFCGATAISGLLQKAGFRTSAARNYSFFASADLSVAFVCYCGMRKALVAVILIAAVSTADARHWRWHWPGRHFGSAPYAYGFAPTEDNLQRRRRESASPADIVPPNWQLQPRDQKWDGKRFLSPDGSSWLAVHSFATAKEPVATHMQSVAFAEGETLTYLRGEHDWIAVSGTKGDKIFYRKAIIACCGKVWHHIAFEYPVERKRTMDPFVMRAAKIIDQAEKDGCEQATSSANPDR